MEGDPAVRRSWLAPPSQACRSTQEQPHHTARGASSRRTPQVLGFQGGQQNDGDCHEEWDLAH